MFPRISSNTYCRSLLKINNIKKEFIANRSLYLDRCTQSVSFKSNHLFDPSKRSRILGINFLRYSSTNNNEPHVSTTNIPSEQVTSDILPKTLLNGTSKESTSVDDLFAVIPDIPPIPTEAVKIIKEFHENGEATFESLGLGRWTPPGMIENALEWLHISCDLPWWLVIIIGTLTARTLIFPLVVISQRSSANMSNMMPKMQEMQRKMTDARQSGNEYEAALHTHDLMAFMKENNLKTWKSFIGVLAQAPVFISFYTALNSMAKIPVHSLREGGLWWFVDLTTPDPYYILPLVTCVTLLITIEVGADSIKAESMGMLKYLLRAVPIILLPVSINFPSAMLCYWTTSNFVSLLQVALLKQSRIRTYLQIPEIKRAKISKSQSSKGFMQDVKSSWTNMKIASQLSKRQQIDADQFYEAGRGPIRTTYQYDPTKQIPQQNILAKKR